jgi:hypothetical protein
MATVNKIYNTLALMTELDLNILSKCNACKAHQVTAMKNKCAIIPVKACCPIAENMYIPPKRHPNSILTQNPFIFGIKKEELQNIFLKL